MVYKTMARILLTIPKDRKPMLAKGEENHDEV